MIEKVHNASLICKSLYSSSYLFIKIVLISSTNVGVETILLFWAVWFRFPSCIRILMVQKRQNCFKHGLVLIFKLVFPENNWFDFILHGNCERSRPGLSPLGCRHDKHRTPLQDGDRSGCDPSLDPGFLRQRSGIFPEGLRRLSVPVGSWEIRPNWTEHPRCGTLSCWTSGTVFEWIFPECLQKFVIYTPQWFQVCFATGCS